MNQQVVEAFKCLDKKSLLKLFFTNITHALQCPYRCHLSFMKSAKQFMYYKRTPSLLKYSF